MERGMSEEEAIIEEEVTPVAAEEGDETEEVIDLNAALLEAMVKRTEILERFAKGEVNEVEAGNLLETVKVPSLERRRRRKR
ncbi:hypothetical protein PABY_08920 [Pyrodictium abyssi]|uniref:RNA polymerase Rpo13 subunit HTH domain-containing protein n=2 Tax=Pyrodictium abyssi TaxID=54256 RepID=A0ABN6ZS29_9CREN|nr:hypothetical protein PABY_08920 [Pyrodictium abyssi]